MIDPEITAERRAELLAESIRLIARQRDEDNCGSSFAQLLPVLLEYSSSRMGFVGELTYSEIGELSLSMYAAVRLVNHPECPADTVIESVCQTDVEEQFHLTEMLPQILRTAAPVHCDETGCHTVDLANIRPPSSQNMTILPFDAGGHVTGVLGLSGTTTSCYRSTVELLSPFLAACRILADAARRNSQRHEYRDRMLESEALADSLLNATSDSIVVLDNEGVISRANPSVARMFGYTPQELVGRTMASLVPPETGTESNWRCREYSAKHRDGTSIPVDVTMSKVWNGRQLQFAGVVRDIRDRKEAEHERAETLKQLISVLDACSQVSVISTD
ncbi:MAG: PAS domain S-box protein, partial [Planctomycetaceae bacterium]|nr:PAS domain S-box protein [Planctomycetaceae bacterium]